MKSGKATTDQLSYGLRRLIYDTMIAAKGLHLLLTRDKDFSKKETAKTAGLIMARNIDDFFLKKDRLHNAWKAKNKGNAQAKPFNPLSVYRYDDDIFVLDYPFRWTSPKKAMISETEYERINKLTGHIVANPPDPLSDDEAKEIIEPLVELSVSFVNKCVAKKAATYLDNGNAPYYVRRLNGLLKSMRMTQIAKPK